MTLIHTNSLLPEEEIRKKISFKITFPKIEYVEIYLTKEVKEKFSRN